MVNLNELLPAYMFCNDHNLPDEAKKIRELVGIYLDFALIEHKNAITTLTEVVSNDKEKAE